MSAVSNRRPDRAPMIVGIILLTSAAVVAFDANRIQSGFTYGISPAAVPYVVAGFLVVLGVGHFIAAFRSQAVKVEPADWMAVALMASGLFGLMASLALGGGFILGSALLFALTARSFGRKALRADLAIGLGLGLVIFLTFNKLLSLTLPMGPIERLF